MHINCFEKLILDLNLTQKSANAVFNLSMQLVETVKDSILALMHDNNGFDAKQSVEIVTNQTIDKIHKFNTYSKRQRKFSQNSDYIAPAELCIGTRFANKRGIESTIQYVSINQTLEYLFSRKDFFNMYFDYNNNKKHLCRSGVYKGFCCGNVFKNNQLFQKYPSSLQLFIGWDDFEICNALQSKASLHKVCGIYFSIKNISVELQSKLRNMFLVCLANTDDIKDADFNEIWYFISNEAESLGMRGVKANGTRVRGAIALLGADNLGANTALGFAGGFNADYYCRFCTQIKWLCQTKCREDVNKIRTVENYEKQIQKIENSEKTLKLKDTEGIKQYCMLNNSPYFHIIVNKTADIMHDLNEGTIPCLLGHLFRLCIEKKVFSEEKLCSTAQFFDYGRLNSRNVPSRIKLDRSEWGQNAAQSRCLFQNLPFILMDYKDHDVLKKVWFLVETMLRITETAYSYEIHEEDLTRLNDDVPVHLQGMQDEFDVTLTPKQHNLVHYAHIIREMGSLVAMSMFRVDAKHKQFKHFRNNTNNFININKTLAIKHQQVAALNPPVTISEVRSGKKRMLVHEDIPICFIEKLLISNSTSVYKLNWIMYNEYYYAKDLIIMKDLSLFNIELIFFCRTKYYFICSKILVEKIDTFSNSLKVKRNVEDREQSNQI